MHPEIMHYSLLPVAFVSLGLLWYLVKWLRRESIAHLPGPPCDTWLVGHVPYFQRAKHAGEADYAWTAEYGLAMRIKGCFGENVLYLTDPKALQYILNRGGYNFPKTHEHRARSARSVGHGIIWADGAQHSRQRKIMNPAFSHSALKGFLGLFLEAGKKTVINCRAKILQHNQESSVVDVSSWLARTTLDVIGQAAFGYKFNSIDDEETELYKSYHNLFADVNYMISDSTIVVRRLMGFPWLSKILSCLPKKDLKRMSRHKQLTYSVAKNLVDTEVKAHMSGKEGGKDVMSIFIQANTSEDPKRRLENEEVYSQISTLLVAGHETTANTISWALYELSKHFDVQHKLRDEIRAVRAQAIARGDQDITISDLDSMKYTVAVMKETLRYHTIVSHLTRRAARDDVIPLSVPLRTLKGDIITAIPVSEGQNIQLSLTGYNRLKMVWGEDADQWRPERFLDGSLPEQVTIMGVLGNLASFSSGLRGCIGSGQMALRALLVEIIDNLEFCPPPGNIEVKRALAGILQPMIKGQESKGTQLPLTVTMIEKNA